MLTQTEFRRVQALHQWLCGQTGSGARLDMEMLAWWEAHSAPAQVKRMNKVVQERKQSGACLDWSTIMEEIG